MDLKCLSHVVVYATTGSISSLGGKAKNLIPPVLFCGCLFMDARILLFVCECFLRILSLITDYQAYVPMADYDIMWYYV